jgi:hypothetical protein
LLNGTDENARSHLDASTSNGWTSASEYETARLKAMIRPTAIATQDKSTALGTIYHQERLD